jgi:dTDP-4-amino-4,6-dideoxygalactose transaminase
MEKKIFNKRLFLSPPHMSGVELDYVGQVFESNWIAPLGPMMDAFEKEFASEIGVSNAAALSSGTAAIHLALRLLDIGPGDQVLCSTFTFCGSVNPVLYQGAEPIFLDSELHSWNMDPDLLRQELQTMAKSGKLPKAVIVVHLYGQSADMDPILEICSEYEIPVIEDAAEALGGYYKNKSTGSMGKFGVFSFNGNKIITTSGGGMLVSNDETLIKRCRFLSTQARDPAPYYEHTEIGYNYRMSNVLAAIGRGQLGILKERVRRKREIFSSYQRELRDVPGLLFMPEPEWSLSNRWLTCVIVDPEIFGLTPEGIRQKLEEYNIESRPLWKPMHMQPVYKNYKAAGGKISEYLFNHGLCLPSGTAMSDEEISFTCDIIRNIHRDAQRVQSKVS